MKLHLNKQKQAGAETMEILGAGIPIATAAKVAGDGIASEGGELLLLVAAVSGNPY